MSRRTPQLVLDYYAARQAQDARFEDYVRGGVTAGQTSTREYRDYFGLGDHSGRPVEERVTFHTWLTGHRSEPQPEEAAAA